MNKQPDELQPDTLQAWRLLCARKPFDEEDVTQTNYVMMLMDFLNAKGETAIKKLAGFYLYCINEIETPSAQRMALRSTFWHDLQGANDEFLLPRSDNYLEFWEKYKPTTGAGKEVGHV